MDDLASMVSTLKNFRTRCAKDSHIDIKEVDNVLSIFKTLSPQQNFELDTLVVLRLIPQCLTNLVVSHSNLTEELWNWCRPFLPSWVNVKDFKFINYISAYLHSTFVRSSELCSKFVNDTGMNHFISLASENAIQGGEYSQFLLETLIKQGHFKTMYNTDTDHRVYFLNMLEESEIQDQDLDFILYLFKTHATHILNSKDKVEPNEFISILNIISKISSNSKNTKVHNDKSLAIDSMYVLRAIHESPKSQEVEIKNLLNSDETRPQHNMKGNLITIIANLSDKNKEIQDLARDTGVIPIILECTNIDADNPFIRERSILCIRCLCDGNPENQSYLSKIDKVTATTAEAKLLGADRLVEQ